jgi:hypothetical protein
VTALLWAPSTSVHRVVLSLQGTAMMPALGLDDAISVVVVRLGVAAGTSWVRVSSASRT